MVDTNLETGTVGGCDFAFALREVKNGKCAWREGWNGKGMFIYMRSTHSIRLPYQTELTVYEPCLVLYTSAGKHQPGWLASQDDMLSDDWVVGTR